MPHSYLIKKGHNRGDDGKVLSVVAAVCSAIYSALAMRRTVAGDYSMW